MKQFRSTIVLVLIGLGFWIYLTYFDHRISGTEDAKQILAVERSDIDSFSIKNGEGKLEFKRTNGLWFVESPVKDRADDEALTALFTTLEGLDLNLRKVPDLKGKDTKEIHKELGVAKGEVSIAVAGKKSMELLLGKEAAVDGKVYARVEGSDAIYVMPADLRTQLAKGVKDWRDRRLSSVSAAEVKKIVLKTAKGEIEAERKNNNWALVRPLKARADNQKLNDLIANAVNSRIRDFVTDSKDLGAFGLTEPRATLSLQIEGGKEPVVIQIGGVTTEKVEEKKEGEKPADDKKVEPQYVYAKVSTREGVVSIPTAIESLILTQPNDLRDASLLRVQSDTVDRITLEAPGSKFIIGRSGEDWKRKTGKADEPINSAAANKLLNDLANAKTIQFVEDVASDLKKYGLDQPVAVVTLSSYSTEGTPESAPGDRPIAKVMFGKTEGDSVYAKVDDEPFIVAVHTSLMLSVLTDPLQWQELKIYDFNKNDIVHLVVTKQGEPALTLDSDKEKGWKASGSDGVVNQVNVQSLVNTLHSLRAVRWAGATKPAEQGLEKPATTVTFGLADKKTGKLTIGSRNGEGLRHATVDGKTGTFLLNMPDASAFELPLLEGQKTDVTTERKSAAPTIPPVVPEPVKESETPKAKEAPAGESKPAPESAPK